MRQIKLPMKYETFYICIVFISFSYFQLVPLFFIIDHIHNTEISALQYPLNIFMTTYELLIFPLTDFDDIL